MRDIELVRKPHDIRCGDITACRHARAQARIAAAIVAARIFCFGIEPGDPDAAMLRASYRSSLIQALNKLEG